MTTPVRFTALFLILILLFSGCGTAADTDTPPVHTDAGTDTAAPSVPDPVTVIDRTDSYKALARTYLEALPEADFENASFVIASPRADVLRPEENSTVYSAAKYERNRQIEERYNIQLVASAVNEADYAEMLRASVKADEYFADLLMLPQYMIGTLAADNLLLNVNSMPFFRAEMPFFDKSSADAATIGDATYAIAGPASFEESMQTAIFFNRDLFAENGLTLPYEDVYSGNWTWDRFFEICASVPDINASANTEYASFSTQYAADTLPASAFYSCGETLIRKESGTPMLAFGEQSSNALSVLRSLYGEASAHTDNETGISRFYSGNSLFMIERLYVMDWMINGKINWGILPLPKADAAQADYVTLASPDTLFFGVQKNASDVMSTAVILSALNASSYGVISDAYLTYTMHHILRDNDSANMIEILAKTRTYDFAYSFGRVDGTLAASTYGALASFSNGEDLSALIDTDAVNAHLAAAFPTGN
ncbi:MAG: extracellular solute-binding protein [Clostridia bacterium]|nr:extracellular solute-binding protein [Clostridia bacterium]